MIFIKVKTDNHELINFIEVKGHDFSDGLSPVCAAVSAVMLGAINTIETKKIAKNIVLRTQKKGYVKIHLKLKNVFVTDLLLIVFIQLKTIDAGFPGKINIQT